MNDYSPRVLRHAIICALSVTAMALMPATSFSGEVSTWNTNNVTTDPGPYTPEVIYASTVYEEVAKTNTNGAIIWEEGSVMAPGMKAVTNDDVSGENCIMTAGDNPDDASTKQCSDPFQTSKRFKRNATAGDASIDLAFDVNGAITPETYRVFEKYLNSSGVGVSGFQIELGFGIGDDFAPAAGGIGLDFSDSNGVIWPGTVVTGDSSSLNLDALFPFGLFGDASTSPEHDIDGYFDPTARARFSLSATRGSIQTTGLTSNYTALANAWFPKSGVLEGYFFDTDMDPDTESATVAHLTDAGWVTLRSDTWWTTVAGTTPPAKNLDGTITAAQLAAWGLDPLYETGPIEDLANINMNYHLTVGDYTQWPTYNGVDAAHFTLRISNQSQVPSVPGLGLWGTSLLLALLGGVGVLMARPRLGVS